MGIIFTVILTKGFGVKISSKSMPLAMAYIVLILTWFPMGCMILYNGITKKDGLEEKLNRPISEVDGLIKCKESIEMPKGGPPDEV